MASQWHERQKITRISVQGATGLSRIAVQKVIDTLCNKRVKSLPLSQIRKYVEAVPYVRNASAYFSGVRHVTIEVEERLPVAHLLTSGGHLRYVDQFGTVLPYVQERTAHNVPVLRSHDGRQLTSSDVLRVSSILVNASRVLDPRLYQSISEVVVNKSSNTIAMITDETRWNLGIVNPERIQLALRDMNVFWHQAANQINMASVQEVDLRWNHQVVLRYHQQSRLTGSST